MPLNARPIWRLCLSRITVMLTNKWKCPHYSCGKSYAVFASFYDDLRRWSQDKRGNWRAKNRRVNRKENMAIILRWQLCVVSSKLSALWSHCWTSAKLSLICPATHSPTFKPSKFSYNQSLPSIVRLAFRLCSHRLDPGPGRWFI